MECKLGRINKTSSTIRAQDAKRVHFDAAAFAVNDDDQDDDMTGKFIQIPLGKFEKLN